MVRCRYGIFFDNPSLGASANGALARLPQPTRLTPPNITAFAPNYQVMYGHNASLQVQRQVLKDMAFKVQYSYWSRGLQLSSTWSWSHAIAEGDLEGGALTDPSQRSRDRGNANADVRHNWVMQGLWAPEVKWRHRSQQRLDAERPAAVPGAEFGQRA